MKPSLELRVSGCNPFNAKFSPVRQPSSNSFLRALPNQRYELQHHSHYQRIVAVDSNLISQYRISRDKLGRRD